MHVARLDAVEPHGAEYRDQDVELPRVLALRRRALRLQTVGALAVAVGGVGEGAGLGLTGVELGVLAQRGAEVGAERDGVVVLPESTRKVRVPRLRNSASQP